MWGINLMNLFKLFLWANFLFTGANISFASDEVFNESTDKTIQTTITKEIDLNSVVKTFKKILSSQLNKRECEKKMFVKKGKLFTANNFIVVELQARITRQYCTRRARSRVFEKTSTTKYKFQVTANENGIALVEVGKNIGKASYLKSLKDIIEQDPKERIAEILINVIEPKYNEIIKSEGLTNHIVNQKITVDSNTITIEFKTNIATEK